ncbi:tetratricopeptide repeat protein [Haliscomenobacter sp.]|uniref:tetratricopeptide repeat protein n=1 Tax=Haliscomenobacter sp. TaxID=2717303 RepID=UPI003BAACCCC
MLVKNIVLLFTLVLLSRAGHAQTVSNTLSAQDSIVHFYKQAKEAAKSYNLELEIRCYKRILALDPSRTEILDTLGKIYFKTRNYHLALEIYREKAQKVSPTVKDYFYIGNSYMGLKNYPLADSVYAKINEMEPTYVIGWYTRARIKDALDEGNEPRTKAQPFYEKYLELVEPNLDNADQRTKVNAINAYQYLARFYAVSGESQDIPKALGYMEKIKKVDPYFDRD